MGDDADPYVLSPEEQADKTIPAVNRLAVRIFPPDATKPLGFH